MAVLLNGHSKDLGGFTITRCLPNQSHTMVGPFIFFDCMGPADFPPGKGIDVRPHPHIGLATVTYLFSGSLLHRDSLGNVVEILPGDVNWMTAGRGIVHSERQTIEARSQQHRNHGIQTWLALPKQYAEEEPAFFHVPKNELPQRMHEEVFMRLIAGDAYGMSAPLKTYSPMFYLDVIAPANRTIQRPAGADCGIMILEGDIQIADNTYSQGKMLLLEENEDCFQTTADCRLIMFGGEHWSEAPHIEWNFVSFSRERIEQAKKDWRNSNFPKIPGDDLEKIPLPK